MSGFQIFQAPTEERQDGDKAFSWGFAFMQRAYSEWAE